MPKIHPKRASEHPDNGHQKRAKSNEHLALDSLTDSEKVRINAATTIQKYARGMRAPGVGLKGFKTLVKDFKSGDYGTIDTIEKNRKEYIRKRATVNHAGIIREKRILTHLKRHQNIVDFIGIESSSAGNRHIQDSDICDVLTKYGLNRDIENLSRFFLDPAITLSETYQNDRILIEQLLIDKNQMNLPIIMEKCIIDLEEYFELPSFIEHPQKEQIFLTLLHEAFNALLFLIDQSVSHNDFSLEHLMIGADGHLKVIDFGSAIFLERDRLTSNLGEDDDLNTLLLEIKSQAQVHLSQEKFTLLNTYINQLLTPTPSDTQGEKIRLLTEIANRNNPLWRARTHTTLLLTPDQIRQHTTDILARD